MRVELGFNTQDIIILSAGELNKNKNHEIVIRALAMMKNPHLKYVVCGKGERKVYLEKLIERYGLGEAIKLLGYRSDMAELLKMSDVFVFPSYREGLAIAVLEAMAVGLPCVVSDIRGNRDLIREKKGGYLIKSYNVEKWAVTLEKILADISIQDTMGLYNLEIIKQYSTKKVNEIMVKNIYGQL